MLLLSLPWHTECSRAALNGMKLLLLPLHTECSRAGNTSVLD
jgi:hypothetical protein